jgi:hypothetical protein
MAFPSWSRDSDHTIHCGTPPQQAPSARCPRPQRGDSSFYEVMRCPGVHAVGEQPTPGTARWRYDPPAGPLDLATASSTESTSTADRALLVPARVMPLMPTCPARPWSSSSQNGPSHLPICQPNTPPEAVAVADRPRRSRSTTSHRTPIVVCSASLHDRSLHRRRAGKPAFGQGILELPPVVSALSQTRVAFPAAPALRARSGDGTIVRRRRRSFS